MYGHQPFYHYNQDCDEITLHVNGERAVFAEISTFDLEPGDFSMIPVGVAHDKREFSMSTLFFISLLQSQNADFLFEQQNIASPRTKDGSQLTVLS